MINRKPRLGLWLLPAACERGCLRQGTFLPPSVWTRKGGKTRNISSHSEPYSFSSACSRGHPARLNDHHAGHTTATATDNTHTTSAGNTKEALLPVSMLATSA